MFPWREVSNLGLPRRGVWLLDHDIECMPNTLVVTLLEGIQLAVVGASICIDLRLLVPLQDTSHGPLTVDEATVPDLKRLAAHAARTSDALHLSSDREHSKALVDHDKLLVCDTALILAVAEPAHAVCDLSVPRGILLPCDLLDVLDGVKRKVDAERHLEALVSRVIEACEATAVGIFDAHAVPKEGRHDAAGRARVEEERRNSAVLGGVKACSDFLLLSHNDQV